MSVFKNKSEQIAKEDSITHPPASTGWPVNAKPFLAERLNDPAFISMNNMSVLDAEALLASDINKNGFAILMKDPTSKKSTLLINPKSAGWLGGGSGGQIQNIDVTGNTPATVDAVFHGANNTAPVIYNYFKLASSGQNANTLTPPKDTRPLVVDTKIDPINKSGKLPVGWGTFPKPGETASSDSESPVFNPFGANVTPTISGVKEPIISGAKEPIIKSPLPDILLPNIDFSGTESPVPTNDANGVRGEPIRTGSTLKGLTGMGSSFSFSLGGPRS